MKCLIVEDDVTTQNLLKIYLSDFGDCFIAVNGKEAVQAVAEALDEDQPFDLICMDIRMPEMNGLEALKAIREIEKQRGITASQAAKVVMTTAQDCSEDIFSAFSTGCEAYIVKPIRKPKLVEELKKLGLLDSSLKH